jgi:cyclophilin family peptidyl-prolyl cis-trans isomerase
MKPISVLLIGAALLLARPVLAADTATPTHSHVRFRFSYGLTFFGDVDVELFDQEKPVTVANFLRYLRAGAYEGTLLHRCIPNFVLQGGAGTVDNVYSSGDFEAIRVIPKFPPITNEFRVGLRYHNTFGTLAMAKEEGDPNSATSSWFFNLADNVNPLDQDNGGFTVFGRITAGDIVLRTFNTFSIDNAILNMFDDFHLSHCPLLYVEPDGVPIGFDWLPVGFFGVDCARYNDLFAVQIIGLDSGDTNSPAVQILEPAEGARLTTDRVLVRGTASDNRAVSAVWLYQNEGPRQLATGQNSWSLLLTNLSVGTNLLDVQSVDSSGNHSPLRRRTVVRVVPPPKLFITSLGAGTYCLHLQGVPNATHRLEMASTIPSANWALLVELTTDSLGVAEYADTPASSQSHRFYRVVCP